MFTYNSLCVQKSPPGNPAQKASESQAEEVEV